VALACVLPSPSSSRCVLSSHPAATAIDALSLHDALPICRGGGRPPDGRGPGRWVMRFEQLREEVARAERRVETRLLRAKTNWRVLGTTWREAWTPGRILVVGLVGGLLVGRARPLDKLGGLDEIGRAHV